jgi:hypothetical protein
LPTKIIENFDYFFVPVSRRAEFLHWSELLLGFAREVQEYLGVSKKVGAGLSGVGNELATVAEKLSILPVRHHFLFVAGR